MAIISEGLFCCWFGAPALFPSGPSTGEAVEPNPVQEATTFLAWAWNERTDIEEEEDVDDELEEACGCGPAARCPWEPVLAWAPWWWWSSVGSVDVIITLLLERELTGLWWRCEAWAVKRSSGRLVGLSSGRATEWGEVVERWFELKVVSATFFLFLGVVVFGVLSGWGDVGMD